MPKNTCFLAPGTKRMIIFVKTNKKNMKKILFLFTIVLTIISCENKSQKVIVDEEKTKNEVVDSILPKWKNCTYAGKQYNWDFTTDCYETLRLIDSIHTTAFNASHEAISHLKNTGQQLNNTKNKAIILDLQKKYENILLELPDDKRKKIDEYYQVAGNRLLDSHMQCCVE